MQAAIASKASLVTVQAKCFVGAPVWQPWAGLSQASLSHDLESGHAGSEMWEPRLCTNVFQKYRFESKRIHFPFTIRDSRADREEALVAQDLGAKLRYIQNGDESNKILNLGINKKIDFRVKFNLVATAAQ